MLSFRCVLELAGNRRRGLTPSSSRLWRYYTRYRALQTLYRLHRDCVVDRKFFVALWLLSLCGYLLRNTPVPANH